MAPYLLFSGRKVPSDGKEKTKRAENPGTSKGIPGSIGYDTRSSIGNSRARITTNAKYEADGNDGIRIRQAGNLR